MAGMQEKDGVGATADHDAEASRFADASAKLFAEQAALMTAMTAYGINLGSQMAGAFFSALSNAVEKKPEASPAQRDERPNVVPLRVVPKAVKVEETETVKVQEPAKATAPASDDLKKISGIGPRLEKVLNGKGIFHFADIAAWTDTDIAVVDEELGLEGRIGRDDWVGQARTLSEENL